VEGMRNDFFQRFAKFFAGEKCRRGSVNFPSLASEFIFRRAAMQKRRNSCTISCTLAVSARGKPLSTTISDFLAFACILLFYLCFCYQALLFLLFLSSATICFLLLSIKRIPTFSALSIKRYNLFLGIGKLGVKWENWGRHEILCR
jgi:hypothetical protein